ncbi:ATPase family associated with various cellular activities (AAA) [Popillia japonica]|uniref:ATPase family associated with various cellular activities (AAA) n=1 Tax=Popillia japonica TaxID=7064 RepID=A0AAW1LBP7_POPJA
MAVTNQNQACLRPRSRNLTDFSKVGGLSSHIKLLREIIIFPLLYGDLYKHFNVKAPRGVLFFGPPGTGKTLVAGALATELSREGNGKVTFYQRKGADILDKWVGESERKLRDLFNQATRSRPSVIFFDELDGLAPVRSHENDQVHCSVVATLLALMDGLDNTSGVVIIGATNRIDAIDPALRRPGRFDRELYFPLPSVNARKEILQVHTCSWRNKPSSEFLTQMSELTSGCCGADLQALCAEAFLCCLKRLYPNLYRPLLGNKVKIEAQSIVIDEIDFLNARTNIIPTNQRLGSYRIRRLTPFIRPLLQKQVDKIIRYIQVLLPQFTQPFKKFLIGSERYVGRLVLKGNNHQGLNVHIVPAILQTLEHIPSFTLDISTLSESSITNARQNLPSILVLSRVDEWWDLIDNGGQLSLTAMLEDLHAGLPLLVIATCSQELPDMLQDYFYSNSSIVIKIEDPTVEEREQFFSPFYSNSSIVIKIEDPTVEEREQFFSPLFFGNTDCSVQKVLKTNGGGVEKAEVKKEIYPDSQSKSGTVVKGKHRIRNKSAQTKKQLETDVGRNRVNQENRKRHMENTSLVSAKRSKLDKEALCHLEETKLIEKNTRGVNPNHCKNIRKSGDGLNNEDIPNQQRNFLNDHNRHCLGGPATRNVNVDCHNNYQTLVDLIDCTNIMKTDVKTLTPQYTGSIASLYSHSLIKQEPLSETSLLNHNSSQTTSCSYANGDDSNVNDIYNVWKRTSHVTSACLAVSQLELLYDTISACIILHKHNFVELIPALEQTLTNFENSNFKDPATEKNAS